MIKKYTTLALVFIVLVIGIYVAQFYFRLGYELSEKPSDWVDFSSFVGGLITPILSFLTLLLLLHSLTLQNEANVALKAEVTRNKRNEKFRSFETHFFNLLEAQKSAFDNFNIQLINGKNIEKYKGNEGVIHLEDFIENMRNKGASDKDISEQIELIDSSEKIYNTIRIFYNITKMTTQKLSDEESFTLEDRKNQFQTLINFTEFAQLRLVLISMQFMDCPSAYYLKANQEFIGVMGELGLTVDPY